jgi:formylglycine-generating enzyme required for sulfatase activity/serine/threonine protein kinase
MILAAALPAQFGRYRILKKVGEGGMGAVYLAEDSVLGRRVALKVPRFSTDDGPEIIERFYREARIAAAIEHPNLCAVYDVGQIEGVHYLSMPFIEGITLARCINRDKPWPARQAVDLVRRLALALEVLHDRGSIHRDLKPGNIMLRPSGEPVLMDFGLARSFQQTSQRLTVTGAAMGTPSYMAPEQVIGDPKTMGPATDVYALGVILYELLTGDVPFTGSMAELYGRILHATPQPLTERQPGLDREVDALCLKALKKPIEDRYPSMAAFAQALEDYLHRDDPAPTPAIPRPAPAPPPVESDATRLVCPTCGKRLKRPAKASGKKMKCPGCKTRLDTLESRGWTIPAPVDSAAAQTAAPSSSPTKRTQVSRPSVDWPPRKRRGPGAAAVVLVLALLVAVLGLGLRSFRPFDRNPSTGALAEVNNIPEPPPPRRLGAMTQQAKEPRPPNTDQGARNKEKDPQPIETPAPEPVPPVKPPIEVKPPAPANQGKRVLAREITNSIGMKLVLIPPGKFQMGSPQNEAYRSDKEEQHEVEITQPFYMGAFEVTQEQYQRVMGKNPSWFHQGRGGGSNHPVENVSWEEAREFCDKLSLLPAERDAKREYRLPTEAEWEYGCRGGGRVSHPFHFGRALSSTEANFDGNNPYGNAPLGPNLKKTAPVGSYRANPFGLYDMHGNVEEWCADWYDENYYQHSPRQDPQGPENGRLNRVLRGGSWFSGAFSCRAACRNALEPGCRTDRAGFRVVVPAFGGSR